MINLKKYLLLFRFWFKIMVQEGRVDVLYSE